LSDVVSKKKPYHHEFPDEVVMLDPYYWKGWSSITSSKTRKKSHLAPGFTVLWEISLTDKCKRGFGLVVATWRWEMAVCAGLAAGASCWSSRQGPCG
jgi:hypothetical protein